VFVTRPGSPDDSLGRALARGGADVVWLPTTATLPPDDPRPLADAIGRLAEFDWLAFTSAHAVRASCEHPGWAAAWASAGEGRPRVAAVGEATAAALAGRGVRVDLVAVRGGARGLVEALLAEDGTLAGRTVLWPRSDIARRDLPDGLVEAGASVADPVAYRTTPSTPDNLGDFRVALAQDRASAVCFLAPSAAEGLAAALGFEDLAPLRGRCLVASIGATTSEALARLGAPPDVEPPSPSAERLAESLLARLVPAQGVTP